MQKITSYFFSEYKLPIQTKLFKRVLYVLVLVHTVYWSYYYDLLFGANAISYRDPHPSGSFKDLAFLLYNSPSINLGAFFLATLGACCILALLLPRVYLIFDIIIWLILVNVQTRIYSTLTGGDFLLAQLLFFNCFLALSQSKTGKFSDLKICLHNFAALAVIIEICVVYFLSALAKIGDPSWISGIAVAHIAHVRHFAMYNPSYNPSFDWLYKAVNYLVLFYQLLFCVIIWIRPLKKPLLVVGVLMHLYIAFVMGLVTFGAVMIAGYVLFYPVKKRVL